MIDSRNTDSIFDMLMYPPGGSANAIDCRVYHLEKLRGFRQVNFLGSK
jgi:hypothetical protein